MSRLNRKYKAIYTLSMSDPHSHYFEVELKLEEFSRPTQNFVMPVWTPGSYLVREFERNVLDFQASDESGRQLPTRKSAKNVWAVRSESAKDLNVRYHVYAFELTVDTSYLDDTHAVVNGTSVFVYPEGLQDVHIKLRIIPYRSWNVISTGLTPVSGEPNAFEAPDYDILADSPIEIGNHTVHKFEVRGVPHEVAIYGTGNVAPEELVADLKRIVEASVPIFGEIPYERYVFIIHLLGNKRGGLEHLNSTLCYTPSLSFQPKSTYKAVMGLFSHEFFHLWNVKRLRPKPLGPFDYTSENYTGLLWVSEGITSYYDDVILRRAGILTVAEYLDFLGENFSQYTATPGRYAQSAEESSFDSWIKYYRQDENAINTVMSYYTKGSIIGWMLDMEIRKKTSSSRTLDDALRLVYNETYKRGRGFMDEEFQEACEKSAGKPLDEIFEKHVRGRGDIEFDHFLAYAGLRLEPKNPKELTERKGYLGIKMKNEDGKLLVEAVVKDTPAYANGLYAKDEIIAVDGRRVNEKLFSFIIENRKPSEVARLTVARDELIRHVEIPVAPKPVLEWRIQKLPQADSGQKALFKGWLQDDWERELKYEERPEHPLRPSFFKFI